MSVSHGPDLPRIVIADDNADMRAFVRTTLEADHHDFIEAADGRELLWELLREEYRAPKNGLPPLIVITDVRMPGYDGLQVVDALREIEAGVPVIVITAFPDDTVRAEVARLGATMLAKPFSRAELRGAVAAAERRLDSRAS